MNCRRLIALPNIQRTIISAQTRTLEGADYAKAGTHNVRFGSLADICSAKPYVCLTPESGQNTISRLYDLVAGAVGEGSKWIPKMSFTERPKALRICPCSFFCRKGPESPPALCVNHHRAWPRAINVPKYFRSKSLAPLKQYIKIFNLLPDSNYRRTIKRNGESCPMCIRCARV